MYNNVNCRLDLFYVVNFFDEIMFCNIVEYVYMNFYDILFCSLIYVLI